MDGKKRIARLRNLWKKQSIPVRVIKVCNWPVVGAIDEFRPTPKEAPSGIKTPRGFIAHLQKRGYEILGSGCYSTVLGKPGFKRVIKVSRMQDNWIDYIQWSVKEGYAGSFAPRVYSWKKFSPDWSVAVVERLEKTLAHSLEEDLALVSNLLYPAFGGNIMAQVYMEDLVPGVFSFMTKLRENRYDSDVYGKNMMIRHDGTLCVTDPCCGTSKITKTRFRSGELSPSVLWMMIENSYRYRSECITQSNSDMVDCL